MKKLVSLILALVLSLGCMLPAMAETTETVEAPAVPFTFALTDFQTWFDLFITSTGLGITPVWTTSEDGLTVEGDAQDLGKVVVTLNADGQVTCLSLDAPLTLDNLQVGAYYFGVSLAMTTLAAKVAEDPAFMEDETVTATMEAELSALVTNLTNRIDEALTAPISETGVIAGHTATVYMSFDLTNMTLIFGYTYEP